MQLKEMMSSEVIEQIQREIKESRGREVLFKGVINTETKKIAAVQVLSRGHTAATPAITKEVGPAMVLIHNHPSGHLSPSGADLRVASLVGNKGAGFLIIDNPVEEGYMVVEPHIPKKRERLKSDNILNFFKPDGILSKGLSNYEYRPQQLNMAEDILKAFNNRRHLLVEAGTGTGKSMAYLLPSIYWAVKNNEKVVISTNTINLQGQLFHKDIPLLEKYLTPTLPREFKTVLVKGRRNYICLRKLNFINQGHEDLNEEQEAQLQEINNLVFNEDLGSRNEFPFRPGPDLWDKISGEAETCLRSKCSHFRGCYLQIARREAASADLLIVNHHLLFADLAVRREGGGEVAVLPKYDHLILDEAHNLEHVATQYLGYKLTYYGFKRLLQFIYKTKGKNKKQGLLLGVRGSLSDSQVNKESKYEILRLIDIELVPIFLKVKDMGNHFFKQVEKFFEAHQKGKESKLRLTEETTDNKEFKENLQGAADDLIGALNQLSYKLKILYEELDHLSEDDVPDYESLIIELEGRITQLQRIVKTLEFISGLEDKDFVYWVEVFYRKNDELSCTLQAAPLEIASEIEEEVVEPLDTVIFTSATLTVNGSFEYFRRSLGLYSERVDDLLIDSPFNYRQQALVAITRDISTPNQKSYLDEVKAHLSQLIELMNGRTMVLFTSYGMLNSFARALKKPLESKGIKIFKQGESSRLQIIKNFKKDERGVIFGTSSFWEGVDIQGDDLSCVVIMKLPFQVPSDPIVEARIEKMKREGINPFMKFMLPNAVIKFKQGFGRLIRSKEDRGVVTVFDPRIYSKSYGRIFLKSLPANTTITVDSFDMIAKKVKDFF